MAGIGKKKLFEKKPKEKKDPNKEEHARLAALSQDDLKEYYRGVGKGCWEQSWDMLQSDGWKLCQGKDLETGIVYSKSYKDYGKVFKLEGYIDISVEECFKILVIELQSSPEWNTTLIEASILFEVEEGMDVAYTTTAAAAGGLIATRDFVSLRHWRTKDDTTLSAGKHCLHPAKPPQKNHIRGENRPGGWAFKKVPNEPNRCHFVWLMNTDLKGWLPKDLIDKAYPKAQLDFLESTRQYVQQKFNK